MKILANDGISAAGKSKLEAAGYTVDTETIAQENLSQGELMTGDMLEFWFEVRQKFGKCIWMHVQI